MIVDFLKNTFMNVGRYKTHSEAVIVACFFNPQVSPYRLLAFHKFFRSIRHLNHRIIECLIGDAKSQLPPNDENITRVRTESLLFHKETLLNKAISGLPDEFRYVFWIDADVLFTNDRWLVESVEKLQDNVILQPFEYCIHLDANQVRPAFDVDAYRATVNDPSKRHKSMWRSFCANHLDHLSADVHYDRHGHVGFAWGAKRELFEQTSTRLRTAKITDQGTLYDKALIGGADHIIAHAAAGQIPHPCIRNSFTENIEEVEAWSRQFHAAVQALGGGISFASGDLYHIWHGDVQNRQYLRRIKDFMPATMRIGKRDSNGFYIKQGSNRYMKQYYRLRESTQISDEGWEDFDEGFAEDMGYSIDEINQLFEQPDWMHEDEHEDVSSGQSPQGDDVEKTKPAAGTDVDSTSSAAAAFTSPAESFTDKSETSAVSENFS